VFERGPLQDRSDRYACAIAEDDIARRKQELDRPAVKLRAYGPQTRREFFTFLRQRDGEPG